MYFVSGVFLGHLATSKDGWNGTSDTCGESGTMGTCSVDLLCYRCSLLCLLRLLHSRHFIYLFIYFKSTWLRHNCHTVSCAYTGQLDQFGHRCTSVKPSLRSRSQTCPPLPSASWCISQHFRPFPPTKDGFSGDSFHVKWMTCWTFKNVIVFNYKNSLFYNKAYKYQVNYFSRLPPPACSIEQLPRPSFTRHTVWHVPPTCLNISKWWDIAVSELKPHFF